VLQVLLSVLNQECCAPLSEDPLNEVKGKSTQSVSVGHHNLAYAASLCFTQKGTQPFPFKVDTGSDVGDNSVFSACREALRFFACVFLKIVTST
jgi:hypothetical protein